MEEADAFAAAIKLALETLTRLYKQQQINASQNQQQVIQSNSWKSNDLVNANQNCSSNQSNTMSGRFNQVGCVNRVFILEIYYYYLVWLNLNNWIMYIFVLNFDSIISNNECFDWFKFNISILTVLELDDNLILIETNLN